MKNGSAQLRRNPISGSTAIIAAGREKSLEQLRRKTPRSWEGFNPEMVSGEKCPFCPGHEFMTPPEVKVYRSNNSIPDREGWTVRTVTNKMPAVEPIFPGVMIEEQQVGRYMVTEGFGYHFVVIETTDHVSHPANYNPIRFRNIVQMWRDMTNMSTGDRNVRYVCIFQNFGPLAGASQPHCHSQIIGISALPPRIRNELWGADRDYEKNKECFYCSEIQWELRMNERIVEKSDNFVAWCPFLSKTPYQVMISPIVHQSYFANISTYSSADRLAEFANLVQRILVRIKVALNDPDYNLYIHTSPANQPEMDHYHWHCQIEPVTMAIQAGFEKGFGMYINPRSPESAAEDLRATVVK